MPNVCSNQLTVTGPAPEIERFLEAAQGTDPDGQKQPFSLRSLFPIPAHLDTGEPAASTAAESWYTWCWEHWGTKWDAFAVSPVTRRTPQECSITFRTAW